MNVLTPIDLSDWKQIADKLGDEWTPSVFEVKDFDETIYGWVFNIFGIFEATMPTTQENMELANLVHLPSRQVIGIFLDISAAAVAGIAASRVADWSATTNINELGKDHPIHSRTSKQWKSVCLEPLGVETLGRSIWYKTVKLPSLSLH